MPPRQSLIQQQNLWKTFFVFLLPLIATNILQNLSGTINTIFVGQMMGVDAIAAVSVYFPILFLLLAFIIGISTGTTVLVGQAWGAQNIEKVQSVVGSTLFMTIIGGIITAILGVFFAHDILELLGTDPKVMHLALPYVQWMLAGSPLLFVYIIYTSILRGVGDSTTPLLALALTSVIGVTITPILLKGYFGFPALGIIAPAIASIISYIAILIFLAIYLNKKNHSLRPNRQLLQHIRHNPELSKIILRLGVPTGIQMITTSMAGLVIVGLVNHYGSHATAAYGAVNQVLNYIQFPAISISIAASIFAAQAIGAGKSDLLARVTRTALGMNFLFTGALIALGYLFSKYLMALFITDPTVVVLGQQLLFIVLWAILFFGAGTIFASIMRASGTVTVPMLINISAILFIEIPCAYWFSSMWGLKGIWVAYALAFVSLCIIQGLYYQFIWKKKTIKVLI
ncbi:MATE family efflux transporter [Acinetobacter pittii]|uniref:MATE family efflux transporter n=1 Tax=Acinetobacter pittii TaxID=48296 RepID=A0A8I1HA61_ACIPI|nr:MATE family efflux transporter [Acinetobacter pittii]MBK1445673.1 MATE family efflux transporter [Acinetobacter pittii]MBW8293528.1 MATE family efflux transporter [Acinetobacter pittii]MCF1282774.1 MATE family efflux transporter [Acinetobacter pittii]MCJ9041326.1 MATE family efflux transporter [Acinetobacter pittii]MCU4545546.1 MATE family efflux transporter [Acinetobacter pittii]